jgi:hypothetical protein
LNPKQVVQNGVLVELDKAHKPHGGEVFLIDFFSKKVVIYCSVVNLEDALYL